MKSDRSNRVFSMIRGLLMGMLLGGGAVVATDAMAGYLVPQTEMVIRDVTAAKDLPVYEHQGRLFVVGVPGHHYVVRVANSGHYRRLAVVSVDGLNVLTGKPAHPSQAGYIIDPYSQVKIDGWRKSLDEVASFTFTSIEQSYAGKTDQAQNVGVIGVALFRERPRALLKRRYSDRMSDGEAPAGQAAEESKSLGTGHGPIQDSPAQLGTFQRIAEIPDRVFTVYYDTEENLRRQGVLPEIRQPDPFPGSFVPDPPADGRQ